MGVMDRKCIICGGHWINGYTGCTTPGCNQYRIDTEASEWPAMLGHAIRRFVRVCEVERLTVAARARMMRHDHACNVRQPGDGCVADTGHTALDRLAAMAMGGEQ